ncbi:fimbria/pilus outer membrane usher protein [Psychrobacter sp. ENNN9_III]|uniref:fimbria/pilus outer membrane usher protein n=1 Tax=Psychrobacter sp. ENNN9_III TaxID=1254334 RepID=UPI00071E8000|nr:fimbria/pilus outer membrane usher protein [Psychrobacter sp. ENNN9_III]
MVQRRHPTSHWIILLAKILFLQSIAVSTIHAAVLTEGISASSVVKDTAFSSKPPMNTLVSNTNDLHSNDNKLVQPDTKRYNPNDNSGLDLYLDVTLNGASKGLIHFVYHDDRLWATTAVLQQMGFILPQDVNDTIPLKSLPDLKIDYDMRQQSLELIAPLNMLNLDTTIRNTRTNKRPIPTVSPGLLLNYNIHATQNHHNAKNLSAYTELRAFNAHGVVSSTALTTGNRSADSVSLDGEWKGQTVRLDTSWSQSFPDKLLTVRAGDILTGALSWTRSTRLGGLQIGTNFDLQPYRSTTPLPSFFGSATLPSEVELYVNGLEHYSGQVPAGPFELKTAPSISGAGTAQLVVTDALGQSTTLNYSLYDTHRLLQPELLDWSLELGAVRESYGIESFDYGDTIAASGTLRYGVSNNFTAEAHAEVVHGLSNAGIGGTWLLGRAGGILFASIASSDSQGEDGIQYSTNYSWNNNRFSMGFNALGTHGVYRDVGSQYGAAPVRRSEQISTGYSSPSLGSFGLSYNQTTQAEMESTKFVSAYWSKAFGKGLSLNMNYNHDLNHSANSNISIGASLSLDRNMSISSSMQHTDEHNVVIADISKSVKRSGGIDWRAQVRRSAATNSATLLDKNIENYNSVSALAELSYLGRYGRVQGGISSIDSQYATYASGIGSLVMMGGGIFPARQIDNGFAVVSTGDIANVPVLLQNNPVGTTNKHGLLLVTSLNAYQNNKIGIDPMQLPADTRINKVNIEAAPMDRTGVMVVFDIAPVRSATIILTDSAYQPIALGSQVKILSNEDAPTSVIGFDGEVYLDTLGEDNILEVTTPSDGICTVKFHYAKQSDEIPLIGPLVCHKVQ